MRVTRHMGKPACAVVLTLICLTLIVLTGGLSEAVGGARIIHVLLQRLAKAGIVQGVLIDVRIVIGRVVVREELFRLDLVQSFVVIFSFLSVDSLILTLHQILQFN